MMINYDDVKDIHLGYRVEVGYPNIEKMIGTVKSTRKRIDDKFFLMSVDIDGFPPVNPKTIYVKTGDNATVRVLREAG